MKVIIINGHAQSGKDTFVKYCSGYAVCHQLSTITLIKDVARVLGWDGVKDEKGRRFLSSLKDAWSAYNNGPFEDIVASIDAIKKKMQSLNFYVFVHVREPDEIEKFKQRFKEICKTVLIRRPIGRIPDNHADQNVGDYNYDYIIENSFSLSVLQDQARRFMEDLMFNETMDVAEECGL